MPNGENFPDMFVACPICAATLVDEMHNIQLICKKCGLQLEKEWKVCPACGTPIVDSPKENKKEEKTTDEILVGLFCLNDKNRKQIFESLTSYCREKNVNIRFTQTFNDLTNDSIVLLAVADDDIKKKTERKLCKRLDYLGMLKKRQQIEKIFFLIDEDDADVNFIDEHIIPFIQRNTVFNPGMLSWIAEPTGFLTVPFSKIIEKKDSSISNLIEIVENPDIYQDNRSADDRKLKAARYGIKEKDGEYCADETSLRLFEELAQNSTESRCKNAAVEWLEEYKTQRKNFDAELQFYEAREIWTSEDSTEEDLEEAFDLFYQSAENGYEWSFIYLARCYESGIGVEPDSKKSLYWMKKACDSEDNVISGFGFNKLGEWYFSGENGCEEDGYAAFDYYKLAAEKGHSKAQNIVGVYYDNGEYVEQDSRKAFYWYKKALRSDENNLPAKYNLGQSYYYGTGVNVDKDYGLQLIQEAADGGYEPAQEWLNENT